MNKLCPLSSLVVVPTLKMNKDMFWPKQENEELLDLKIPYLIIIGILIYFENCTWLDITFSIYLIARYSFILTWKHYIGLNMY